MVKKRRLVGLGLAVGLAAALLVGAGGASAKPTAAGDAQAADRGYEQAGTRRHDRQLRARLSEHPRRGDVRGLDGVRASAADPAPGRKRAGHLHRLARRLGEHLCRTRWPRRAGCSTSPGAPGSSASLSDARKYSSRQHKIYALPLGYNLQGLMYNTDLFASLGLKEPTTFNELLALCGKIRAAGKIPIAAGLRRNTARRSTSRCR